MPTSLESPTNNTPDRQPLVGRFVHFAVVLSVIAGCAALTWLFADRPAAWVLGAIGAAGASLLWFGTATEHDPERSPVAWVSIPGPLRLSLELALVIAAGVGIWIIWNRAASETFLTVAALDFAVRYQRIAALLRSS